MQRCPSLLRFYASQSAAGKSLLATLRRRTGFPIGKCKEALTEHGNDLEEAEKWLYSRSMEEGWAKAQELFGRRARQGLIGVIARENQAAMVEVNCETDFVARNEKFQTLVSTITQTTLERHSPKLLATTTLPSVDHLTTEVIAGSTTFDGQKTLADEMAENINRLSENLLISRGCTMSSSKGLICSFAYSNVSPPGATVAMGSYAALVHVLPSGEGMWTEDRASALGKQLCQHVIGMNPVAIYSGEGVEEGRALVEQNFVLNDSVTVGELLQEGGATVSKFVRYALGETQVDSDD